MARSPRSLRPRPPVDEHAASELRMYLDNDAKLYARRKSFWQNIARKMITGKYDPEKAAKLWLFHVDDAAKAYDVEFGSGGKRASPYSSIRVGTLNLFDKPTREAVARELAADEERAIRGGEYGDLYTLAGRKPPKTKSNPAKLGGKVGRAARVLADYRWTGLHKQRANPRKRYPKVVTVRAKLWTDSFGNTYHTTSVAVDGVHLFHTPPEYGYGTQYEYTAYNALAKAGIVPPLEHRAHGGTEPPWQKLQDLGIKYDRDSVRVPRKKDL